MLAAVMVTKDRLPLTLLLPPVTEMRKCNGSRIFPQWLIFCAHRAVILMHLWLFVGLCDIHGGVIVLTWIIVSRIHVNIPQITFFLQITGA
jgi:hypothetical protein